MTDIFHTFEEAQNYCLSFISKKEKERTLKRITTLMNLLGNPQNNLRVIHVTGSYGKSSTAYMVASILEQKGLTVGLHMKPHLQSMTERMCINRIPIPDNIFVQYVNKIKQAIDEMKEQPTYFELLVAIMLIYFSDNHVDVAVIEAGRGGRLDATNICNSEMLVLTNIFPVHTDILGRSKKEIMKEKMGLTRTRTKIIAGVTQKPLQVYMLSLAEPLQATVQFCHAPISQSTIPLRGAGQRENAALAILAAKNYTELTEKHITAAFASMKLPGRFEVLHIKTNTIIMDSAHDAPKMRFLLHDLQNYYPHTRMTIVLKQQTKTENKKYMNILQPIADTYILVAMNKEKTRHQAPFKNTHYLSSDETITYMKGLTHTTVLVTGSMQLIGYIRTGLSLPYTLK